MDDNESTIPIMEVARPVILKQDLDSIQSRNRQQVRRFCFIRSCDEPSTKDGSSSVARGGGAGGGAIAPPLACRSKCRIRKIPRFSISKTVFCTGLDYFETFI